MNAVRERCTMNYGATRAVLLLGRYAHKFPFALSWKHFLLGLISNMQEREFGATGWPELCPVVFGLPGGLLVVMRRAEPLTDAEWDGFQPAIADGWYVANGEYYVPAEGKRDSFGKFDGRIVAVDYGN